MIIGKLFTFDASHMLPKHDGKCKNLHGHTYRCEVEVEGGIISDPKSSSFGMVMDLARLKRIIDDVVIEKIDHTHLNDTLNEYPTAEKIALWISSVVSRNLPIGVHLKRVVVWETPTSYAKVEL